jgi:dihydroorotate dehydrogenase|nr:hypothetical protein [uncultured Oscillibacter sp.]
MPYSLSNIKMKNYLTASSSPLTESVERLRCCYEAGFSSAILKSAAAYVRAGTGHGRKVVYTEDGYYADASFEREILTLEEGIALYKTALDVCPSDMLLIPSVSASSLAPEEWLQSCKQFASCGAALLQLDFFYLGTLSHDSTFFEKLRQLLTVLGSNLDCSIMPKLNLNFEPNQICKLLQECGVKTVSLLDSMREDPDRDLGLHKGTTSYFGNRQLPWTIEYLKAAKRCGLETCAGGGVVSKKDVDTLLSLGADMVQTASYVLCRDFTAVQDLLEPTLWSCSHSEILKHNPWCDYKDGEPCEKCGACALHKTSMQATNAESLISACMGGLL